MSDRAFETGIPPITQTRRIDPIPVLLAARDIGEPAPPPPIVIGGPVPALTGVQHRELQYVFGGKVLTFPREYMLSDRDNTYLNDQGVNEVIPTGTPFRHYDVYATAQGART